MTLTLATYNIHGGVGGDGRFDAERIAQVINEIGPDIIALQEVEQHRVEDMDLLGYLAARTDLIAIAGPTLLRETREYGNALLTQLPILSIHPVDLSLAGREPRGALDVVLDWQGRPLQVIATHLGLRPGERRHQTRRLLDLLANGEPDLAVLLGDLNEWLLWGRPLRWLHRELAPTAHLRTYPAKFPLFALDRIWVNRRSLLQALETHDTPLARIASDHLPLVARLDFSKQSEPD